MSIPSPPPSHIYKILPSTSTFPIPIPASYEFKLSPLDSADGFLHFSTASQLESTLSRFFREDKSVMLLKCAYPRLSGFKVVKWEAGGDSLFPHVYAMLEGEDVESHLELVNTGGEWAKTLAKARESGWLQG